MSRSSPRPVLASPRLVVFLDREVVDAYVRGAAVVACRGRAAAGASASTGRDPSAGLLASSPVSSLVASRGWRAVVLDACFCWSPVAAGVLAHRRSRPGPHLRRANLGRAGRQRPHARARGGRAASLRPEVDRRRGCRLGLRWHFAVDGISGPAVLLTPLSCCWWSLVRGRTAEADAPGGAAPATFHGCLLLVELGALATFLARDAVLFFVAFEVVLVPMWVLITASVTPTAPAARADAGGPLRPLHRVRLDPDARRDPGPGHPGRHRRPDAARRWPAVPGSRRPTQLLVAVLLVAGLAVKVPVFPLHTWLPAAHTTAPTAGLGAARRRPAQDGHLRPRPARRSPRCPRGSRRSPRSWPSLGVVGIIWGGLACLVERDLKRLVAYSSVAHMGFVALGLACGTQTGLQAALFANIAHGVVSALLFFVVGGLKERWGAAPTSTPRGRRCARCPRAAASRSSGGLRGGARAARPGRLLGRVPRRLRGLVPRRPDCPPATSGLRSRGGRRDGYRGRLLAAGAAPGVGRARRLGGTGVCPAIGEGTDARGAEWAVLAILVVAVIAGGLLPRPLLAVTADDAALLTGAVVVAPGTVQAGPVATTTSGSAPAALAGGRP